MLLQTPSEDVREDVEGTLDGVHPVLQIGDPFVHDVLPTVDVGQDFIDVVLGLNE